MISCKEFFEENTHLKFAIQHLGIHGGGFMINVYNTTHDIINPIFEHFITDFELERLNVDFEIAIMTPIINWWEDVSKKHKAR